MILTALLSFSETEFDSEWACLQQRFVAVFCGDFSGPLGFFVAYNGITDSIFRPPQF